MLLSCVTEAFHDISLPFVTAVLCIYNDVGGQHYGLYFLSEATKLTQASHGGAFIAATCPSRENPTKASGTACNCVKAWRSFPVVQAHLLLMSADRSEPCCVLCYYTALTAAPLLALMSGVCETIQTFFVHPSVCTFVALNKIMSTCVSRRTCTASCSQRPLDVILTAF